jgi:hypothetical protein
MKRRGHLEALLESWRIVLKWILSGLGGVDYMNLSQDSVESPCENDNKSRVFSGSTVHNDNYLIVCLLPSLPAYLSEHTELTLQVARGVLSTFGNTVFC